MSGSQNLIKRNGVWYYNRRVPARLVPILGKSTIRASLSTGDKSEAKKRRAIKDVEWDARFAQLEGSAEAHPDLPEQDVTLLMRRYVERKSAEMEKRFAVDPIVDPELRAERYAEADHTVSILRDPANPELAAWVTSVGSKLLTEAGLPAPAEGEGYAKFSSIVVRGLVELSRREMALYREDRSQTHFDQLFGPKHAVSVPFRQIANQFLGQRKEEAKANNRSQKWIDKLEAIVGTLCELVGGDRSIDEIDYDVCQQMRSLIAKLPANRTKKYPKLSVHKAIEHTEKAGYRTLAHLTQAEYIAAFRSIMELAAAKKLIGHNPALSLRPLTQETLAPHEKRLPLTPEQIIKIFTSDFYFACAPNAEMPYSGRDRD